MPKRPIQGSRAIVTGASSGIGRELTRTLVAQGARVVAVARREDRMRDLGPNVEVVVGDVTDPPTREQAVQTAADSFGGLDLLINNAGVGAMGRFDTARSDTIRRLMEVNFFATVEMTRLALPLLKTGRRPMLVNLSSIMGLRGAPHNSEYSASKFALQGFSEALRAELVQDGIDVLVVSPGTTETEFFERLIASDSQASWPEHAPVSAAYVARAIVRAIRQGKHAIVPYRLGRVLYYLNRISPRLVDRIMARYA